MAPKRKAKTPSVAVAAADGNAKVAASSSAKKPKAAVGSATKSRPRKTRRKIRYTIRKKAAKKTVDSVKKVDKNDRAESADESAEPEKNGVSATVIDEPAKPVSKRLIIEHCTQCTSFKNQAAKFEKSLKEKIPGLEVSINPDKPRRGCFEVRDAEGNTFLTLLPRTDCFEVRDLEGNVFFTLLDLKRPFPELRALNVEEQVAIIVSKNK